MKHDLVYDDFKKYEVFYEGKEDFDNSFKYFTPYSFSHRFRFKNNYGASVVKHFGSYGFEEDLFELAVLDYEGNEEGHLCYSTKITNDVEGFLRNDEVLKLLNQIKNLKR